MKQICEYCKQDFEDGKRKRFCSRSCAQKERANRPEIKKQFQERMKKFANDPIEKIKNSERQKIAQNRPEVKEAKSNAMKLIHANTESREKYSQAQKIAQNRPEVKEANSQAQKIAQNRPEVKEVHRKRCTEMWKNDEYRKYMIDALSQKWKDSDYAHKQMIKKFKYKNFEMPSGRIVKLQGYEPQVLEQLLQSYSEDDIICEVKDINKEIGKILYQYEDKERRYFPDFYIKSINTIIEVKSQWTFDKWKDKNLAKERACIEQGFNFEFVII